MKMRKTEINFLGGIFGWKTSFPEHTQKKKRRTTKKLKRKRKHELIIEKGTGSANW